jgi:SAM-dependent methyltransferase
MDIREIAPDATFAADGVWHTRSSSVVSYPDEGHAFCAGVEERSFWFAHRNRAIIEAVRKFPARGGPIFDVGAGNGYVALALQNAGFDAVAIEPGLHAAQRAATRGVRKVIRGTLPSPELRIGTAGAIGLFDVIEHIEADQQWLASLRPYLMPGGRLYITTPAYAWLWSEIDVQSGHYRRYSMRALRAVVEGAGFDVEYTSHLFWCLPPLLFLTRKSRRTASPGEHTIGGGVGRAAANVVFAWEARAIRAGLRVPFGGTCLLVAQSRTV